MTTRCISRIYTTEPAEGFEWLLPVADKDFDRLTFDGTSRVRSWVPVRVKRLRRWEDGKRLKPSDFPADSAFVVSRAAKTQLGSCLEEAGELLPLDCCDGEFWTLNVTTLVDALDEEKSDVLRASDTGQLLMIHRPSFRADRLGPEIFKLSQMPRGLIYVTEAFVHRVRATSLEGLDFKLVWSAS